MEGLRHAEVSRHRTLHRVQLLNTRPRRREGSQVLFLCHHATNRHGSKGNSADEGNANSPQNQRQEWHQPGHPGLVSGFRSPNLELFSHHVQELLERLPEFRPLVVRLHQTFSSKSLPCLQKQRIKSYLIFCSIMVKKILFNRCWEELEPMKEVMAAILKYFGTVQLDVVQHYNMKLIWVYHCFCSGHAQKLVQILTQILPEIV